MLVLRLNLLQIEQIDWFREACKIVVLEQTKEYTKRTVILSVIQCPSAREVVAE